MSIEGRGSSKLDGYTLRLKMKVIEVSLIVMMIQWRWVDKGSRVFGWCQWQFVDQGMLSCSHVLRFSRFTSIFTFGFGHWWFPADLLNSPNLCTHRIFDCHHPCRWQSSAINSLSFWTQSKLERPQSRHFCAKRIRMNTRRRLLRTKISENGRHKESPSLPSTSLIKAHKSNGTWNSPSSDRLPNLFLEVDITKSKNLQLETNQTQNINLRKAKHRRRRFYERQKMKENTTGAHWLHLSGHNMKRQQTSVLFINFYPSRIQIELALKLDFTNFGSLQLNGN